MKIRFKKDSELIGLGIGYDLTFNTLTVVFIQWILEFDSQEK